MDVVNCSQKLLLIAHQIDADNVRTIVAPRARITDTKAVV